jgi:hypothetical protein
MFLHFDAFRINGYYLPPNVTEDNYRPAWDMLCGAVRDHANDPGVETLLQDIWEVTTPPEEAKSRP